MGDDELLATLAVDDDTAVAANAVGAHVVEFVPADAAGGTTAFEQALAVQDQRLGPVGQHQGHEEEAKTKTYPGNPDSSAGNKHLGGADTDRSHAADQRQVIEQEA